MYYPCRRFSYSTCTLLKWRFPVFKTHGLRKSLLFSGGGHVGTSQRSAEPEFSHPGFTGSAEGQQSVRSAHAGPWGSPRHDGNVTRNVSPYFMHVNILPLLDCI